MLEMVLPIYLLISLVFWGYGYLVNDKANFTTLILWPVLWPVLWLILGLITWYHKRK